MDICNNVELSFSNTKIFYNYLTKHSTVPQFFWNFFDEYIFPTRLAFSSRGKNFHQRGIVFPEGNFPSQAKRGYRELARGKYDSPRVEIFPREENAGRVGKYFPLWKYKFPWICTNFCPALVAQSVECLATEPRIPGSNPVSC